MNARMQPAAPSRLQPHVKQLLPQQPRWEPTTSLPRRESANHPTGETYRKARSNEVRKCPLLLWLLKNSATILPPNPIMFLRFSEVSFILAVLVTEAHR